MKRREMLRMREALSEGWVPQDSIRQFDGGMCFWLGRGGEERGGGGEGMGGVGRGCRLVLLQGDITKWSINGKTDAIVSVSSASLPILLR